MIINHLVPIFTTAITFAFEYDDGDKRLMTINHLVPIFATAITFAFECDDGDS